MLATMKASMVHDIPTIANKADWGWVLGWFKWTYAVLSPFGGYICRPLQPPPRHRLQPVRVVGGHVVDRSCDDLQRTRAARACMGVSEAFYIPAALALIADYHQGRTRSRAVGIHQTGIYVGQILGGFAGYVADSPEHGWRWAFSTCGMIGVIYAIPLLSMMRNPARTASEVAEATSPGRRRSTACSATATSSCSFFTSRCPPSLAGWCAIGCRTSSKRSSVSAKARRA